MAEHDTEVLDLTLSPLALGNPAASTTKPKAAKTVQKAQGPVTADSKTTASTHQTSEDDTSNPAGTDENPQGPSSAGFGSASGDSALGWKDVTRLPKVLKEIKAAYPTEAKSAQIAGAVVMDVVIDRDGKVQDVSIVKGPGHGLNESAAEALKGFQFSPAYKEEKPVAVKIRYTYRFKLDVN